MPFVNESGLCKISYICTFYIFVFDFHVSCGDSCISSQQERKQYFKSVCANISSFPKLSRMLVVDEEHSLVYLDIPKVSSSTWKRLLAVSTSLGKTLPKHFGAHDLESLKIRGLEGNVRVPGNSSLCFPSKKTFVIVRHPITRFMSAFYDKMARKLLTTDPHYDKWMRIRRHIFSTLHGQESLEKFGNKTFEIGLTDFAAFVGGKEGEAEILNNPHWRPQSQMFNPCLDR